MVSLWRSQELVKRSMGVCRPLVVLKALTGTAVSSSGKRSRDNKSKLPLLLALQSAMSSSQVNLVRGSADGISPGNHRSVGRVVWPWWLDCGSPMCLRWSTTQVPSSNGLSVALDRCSGLVKTRWSPCPSASRATCPRGPPPSVCVGQPTEAAQQG